MTRYLIPVWLAKYGIPIFFMGAIFLSMHEAHEPWKPAIEILEEYPNHFKLVVGFNYSGGLLSKTYMMIDRSDFSSQIVEVISVQDRGVTSLKSNSVSFIFGSLFLVLLSLYVWFRTATYNKKQNEMDGSVEPPIR